MKDLLIFYLVTSAIQVFPFICIKLSLAYGIQLPSVRNIWCRRLRTNLELRNIGTSRFEQLFQLFDSDAIMYSARLSLMNCFLQLIAVVLISLAIQFDVSLQYVTGLLEWLPRHDRIALLRFSIITGLLQLMPVLFVFMTFFFDIPLPFMPRSPENRAPASREIMRWEQNTEDIASMRLTRLIHSDRTFIFANCRDDRLGVGFKFVLWQEKEMDARTKCYMYDESSPHLYKINPAPVTVSELEKIFKQAAE